MQSGVKVDIKIQSISDIITNSSSEVFCTITGKDVESIYQVLSPFFLGDDSEMDPTLCYDEDSGSVQVWMPYGYDGITTFYRAGLKAVLDQAIGENNYSVEYEF